jgi:hypothetical protein
VNDKVVQLRSGKEVADTGKVLIGLAHQRRLHKDSADPFSYTPVPWHKRPDAIIEAVSVVGIIGVIVAIYWGWLP